MAIHIQHGKKTHLLKKESKIHSVPFKILADIDAKVADYFESSIKPQDDNTMKASFRGYPLNGAKVDLPPGYVGIILHESVAPVCEKEERRFHVTNKFSSFSYWNWDRTPSKNDRIIQALDWIEIAEALHSPIIEE